MLKNKKESCRKKFSFVLSRTTFHPALVHSIVVLDNDINCSHHRPLSVDIKQTYINLNMLLNTCTATDARNRPYDQYRLRWDKANLGQY